MMTKQFLIYRWKTFEVQTWGALDWGLFAGHLLDSMFELPTAKQGVKDFHAHIMPKREVCQIKRQQAKGY